MKKMLLIFAAAMTFLSANAQTDTTWGKVLNCYAAASLSTSGGDNFEQISYASAEVGVCHKNMSFGFVSGRGSLAGFSYSTENIGNYWFELKTSASVQLGVVKGYALAGWGQYYNSHHRFIEYGVGLSYSVGKFDLMAQVSNWDKVVYVSPGVAYNFSFKKR